MQCKREYWNLIIRRKVMQNLINNSLTEKLNSITGIMNN
jgi:hypothetical protein